MAQKQVLIVCGEASGEVHAANLCRALKNINPDIRISGVGSDLLRNAGAQVFYDIKGLAALGLFDVLVKLPKFFALKNLILRKINTDKPDAIIFVDFSGFNLRLAKAINNKIQTIYYISPQVWASRPGRIETIKKYISKVIVIFPFEKEFYRKYGVEVDFVGHPLLDTARPSMPKEEFLSKEGLSTNKRTIALLPGSRKTEIKHILPVMLIAGLFIRDKIKNIQFIIAKSPNVDWDVYNRITRGINLDLEIIEGKTYDCLGAADFALVASGTATLETAIIETPLAIIYKMGILNYLLYRPQVKIPYIGMVNIVAGRKIAEEFIQFSAKPRAIAAYAVEMLSDPKKLNAFRQNLSSIKKSLGENGACARAAQIIIGTVLNPR